MSAYDLCGNGYCADTDYSLWRFDVLARRALHARLRTNGLYGRKTFMPPPRFTAGLLLFSERSDGDVINLRSCVNFRLLSRQRNYGTFWLLLDKVFGFSGSWVAKAFRELMKIFVNNFYWRQNCVLIFNKTFLGGPFTSYLCKASFTHNMRVNNLRLINVWSQINDTRLRNVLFIIMEIQSFHKKINYIKYVFARLWVLHRNL